MSLEDGSDAIKLYYDYVKTDLRIAIIMTGCNSLNHATPKILVST
jgi:hypothetical protein